MQWSDIACIVFICVTSNHLGLIKAVENVTNIHFPVVGCVKCFTFWSILSYTIVTTQDVIRSLAISFLASYAAIWIELMEGLIDTLYIYMYGTIISTNTCDTITADSDNGDSPRTLSELREDCEDEHQTT